MTILAPRMSDYATDDVTAQRYVAEVLKQLNKYPPISITIGDDMEDSEIKLSDTVSIQVGVFSPYACINVVKGDTIYIGDAYSLTTYKISQLVKEIEKYMK